MMRILHFVPVYKPAWRYGGPVRSVSLLCEAMKAQGADVTVFTTDANGPSRLDVAGGRFVDVGGVPTRYFRSVNTPWGIDSLELRREIGRLIKDYHIVHLAAIWQATGPVVSAAAGRAGVPYVHSLRAALNPWSWARRRPTHRLFWSLLARPSLARARAIHVTCDSERVEAMNLGFVDHDYITVPNGIEVSEFERPITLDGRFHRLLGLSPDVPIILFFGRLDPRKGIETLLRAAASPLARHRQWRIAIVGPGDDQYKSSLRLLARAAGIEQQVVFCDQISGPDRLAAYHESDLFVLTSYNENFGMSVVEAMSAGLPVLVSDRVGISSEIQADQAGVVTPMYEAAVESHLEALLSCEARRRQYGLRAAESACKRFSVQLVAARMLESYERLLSTSAVGRRAPVRPS